jgi:diguanylate cyclase (GGDEF)-like protein
VALCVSIPMGALAAQYDLRIRRSHDRLEELASTDPLTGLLNRRSFRSAVTDELARMRRTGNRAAIAFVDLDHFKFVNDTYGHHFGDKVLCEVAVLLSDELRHPFDKLCRWGGEEFVILTSNVTREQAELVLERLRARLADHLFESGHKQVRVTASFGAAQFDNADDVEHVMKLADAALYDAKSGGRNKVVFSTVVDGHGQLAVAS